MSNAASANKAESHPWRVSPHVWLAALVVALLRGLPFIALRFGTPPAERAFLPIAYIPQDWLAYAAMVRQAAAKPFSLLENPFTTEAHDGRFVLLYHQSLGGLARLVGLDPFWALELSRIPLLLLFFFLLWRLLGRIYGDEQHRVVALWLVALSGGLSYLVEPALGLLPKEIADVGRYDFWAMHGWSSFEAFYNPLWLAGLCLVLPLLGATLDPRRELGRRVWPLVGLGFVLLSFMHPYSAIAVLAVVLLNPLLQWVFGPVPSQKRALLGALPIVIGLLVAGGISLWQLQDSVYRASSAGLWGTRQLPVFWYPVTYGALLYFVLRGWQSWIRASHPWRFALGAWTLAVIVLHSSPILNGYHFVYFLHLPLVIVAAPSLTASVKRMRRQRLGRWALVALALLLFASPFVVTVRALGEAFRESKVSADTSEVLARLALMPPGHVLAPTRIGHLVPAFTLHHVYAGHWFMTPSYEDRKAELRSLFAKPPLDAPKLHALLSRERIDYLVLPAAMAAGAMRALSQRGSKETRFGTLSLIVLGPRASP